MVYPVERGHDIASQEEGMVDVKSSEAKVGISTVSLSVYECLLSLLIL